MCDDKEYKYECTLTPELIEKAYIELNEMQSNRDHSIQLLRDKVVKHRGLKCPLESSFLVRFLRARKFDHEKAYQLLLKYYTMRNKYATILKDLIPSEVAQILESGIVCILPIKDAFNRKILYFRPGKWVPREFPMIEIARANLLSFEEAIKNEETQVCGIVAIGNFTGVGWSHLMNMDLTYMRINIELIHEAFPMLFKGMHLINEPALMVPIFTIVKPLLNKKLIERLKFHKSLESLHREFDKKCLPQELGGDLPPSDELAKTWKQTLVEDELMFQEMKHYGIIMPCHSRS